MKEEILIKTFEELDLQELYDILKLRSEVFVVEQDCVYQDLDDKDQDSIHVLLYESGDLAAYCRVLAPGLAYDEYSSIGRVVTHPKHRKKGLGVVMMKKAISYCRMQFPGSTIKISAQSYLERFYQSFDFVNTGDFYLEDGIPHQAMILNTKDIK